MKDLEIWQNSRNHRNIETIKNGVSGFYELHLEYIKYIQKHIETYFNTQLPFSSLEPGCGYAAGSYYLSRSFDTIDITLLDYDPKVIEDLQKVYTSLGKNFKYTSQDMFSMDFSDTSFDIIYNGGVLEHFTFTERCNILKEYARVLKTGGYMYIVIPNHYNIRYRLFYKIANMLGKWKVAKEHKIYDFQKECEALGLEFLERKTFNQSSLYGILTLLILRKKED